LIAAYYLLYLLKSDALVRHGALARGAVAFLAFCCFFYTAWAWTENHVLSLHSEMWQSQYKSGRLYRNSEIWPRLGYWLTTGFPTLAVAVAWQLRWGRRFHDPINVDLATHRLRAIAVLGLATAASEGWIWQLWLEPSIRATVMSRLAAPYAWAALAGMILQGACWLTVSSGASLTTRRLALISVGTAVSIISSLAVREARRLAVIDVASLYDMHRHAAGVGGMGVFLFFFAVNATVIVGCILIVKRAFRPIQ
jgi:hypothetical protein